MQTLILSGERLILRPPRRSDAEAIYRQIKDPAISRHTFIPHPYELEHAYDFIKRASKSRRDGKTYSLSIFLKDDNRLIGGIGLERINTKHRNAEIGYWLARKYWGQGYTSEAVTIMLKFAFNDLKLRRVFAGVMHPNAVSARLLERCGFTLEGRMRKSIKQRGRWMDILNYGILTEEFEAR